MAKQADKKVAYLPPLPLTKPEFRTRVGNGKALFVERIDERKAEPRRIREIQAALLSQFMHPTVEQILLARKAAGLVILTEGEELKIATGQHVDSSKYATACNALRRVLADLRPKSDGDLLSIEMALAMAGRRRTPAPTQTTARDANAPAPKSPAPEKKTDETLPPQTAIALGVQL